jgi:hypothetical protein
MPAVQVNHGIVAQVVFFQPAQQLLQLSRLFFRFSPQVPLLKVFSSVFLHTISNLYSLTGFNYENTGVSKFIPGSRFLICLGNPSAKIDGIGPQKVEKWP